MQVKLKEKIDGRWKRVKIDKIMNSSICNYMIEAQHDCVGAIYETRKEKEKPILMMTNSESMKSYYQNKGFLVITAVELAFLIGSDPIPKITVNTFKDSEFESFALTEETKE